MSKGYATGRIWPAPPTTLYVLHAKPPFTDVIMWDGLVDRRAGWFFFCDGRALRIAGISCEHRYHVQLRDEPSRYFVRTHVEIPGPWEWAIPNRRRFLYHEHPWQPVSQLQRAVNAARWANSEHAPVSAGAASHDNSRKGPEK